MGHAFDLEDRTLAFAKRVVKMCKELSRNPVNSSLIGQIIRSAGSVGANYREANDALGRKDFFMRMKISRKEAKETLFWIQIISEANPDLRERLEGLEKEAIEIKNILSAIILKSESKK